MEDVNKIDYNKDELANARLGAIVSSSEDAIISKDLNGVITTWNNAAERMFGYTEAEAVGQSITLLFPDDRIDEEEEILAQLKRGERIKHYETIRLHKDGTPLKVSLSISPIRDQTGNIIGASKIARDITEQKHAEQALRESEEKYRTLFESMDEGFCIIKMFFDENDVPVDYLFLEMNTAFEDQTGLHNAEGKRMRDLEPHHEKHWFEIYGRIAKTGQPERFTHRAENLDDRWYDVYAFRIGNPGERKVAILFNDITERKRNQQKLEQMNEKLEEKVEERTTSLKSHQKQLRLLASELSKAKERERQRLATDLHDNLGQLLAVGKIKLESLAHKAQLQESQRELDELKHMLDQALSYSRKLVTDLKPPPSMNTENLKENIGWIAEKMERYNLDVTIQDDGKSKELDEDVRATVFQCVRELLFNIVKHAGVNRADITLQRKEDYVEIQVNDEGAGFELEGEILPLNTENGFGLFSIKERLKVVGGTIDVYTRPGKGTSVTIAVPLDSDKYSEPSKYVRPKALFPQFIKEGDGTMSTIGVLIVDDHELMREGLSKLIEGEKDMRVIAEAADGEEALEMATAYEPEVVVMDVNMPGINGIEATRILIEQNADICVIGLSFHKEERVENAMYEAGASAYLTKSDVFETLCVTIRNQVYGQGLQSNEE